uniref:Fizzy and cell division cycle 20 related 1 n=1 Tax=Hucho hucho TaxID=62062 RepID=A0A4W5NKY2_9TELE
MIIILICVIAQKVMRNLMPNNSPMSSPSKHGDGFNPSRAGANWSSNFHRMGVPNKLSSCNCGSLLADGSLFGVRITLSAKRSTLDEDNRISLLVVTCQYQKFLLSPWKLTSKIAKIPFKVLDAPELQDDFYLNLVDWSALNVLSRLRHLSNSGVTRLCDLAVEGDSVTSVGWSEGNHMAVRTHKGYVQIWDAAAGKKLFTLEGHTARVGEHSGGKTSFCALAWNHDQLPSGSRDLMILQMIRTSPLQSERRLQGPLQVVCVSRIRNKSIGKTSDVFISTHNCLYIFSSVISSNCHLHLSLWANLNSHLVLAYIDLGNLP